MHETLPTRSIHKRDAFTLNRQNPICRYVWVDPLHRLHRHHVGSMPSIASTAALGVSGVATNGFLSTVECISRMGTPPGYLVPVSSIVPTRVTPAPGVSASMMLT